jgi:hypothetical protein
MRHRRHSRASTSFFFWLCLGIPPVFIPGLSLFCIPWSNFRLNNQDEFTLANPAYVIGVHGYILIYSIATMKSYDMIRNIHDKILHYSGMETIPTVIVGSKCDLNSSQWVYSHAGGADEIYLLIYVFIRTDDKLHCRTERNWQKS